MDSNQNNPKKLFIGNLSYNVTESQLRDIFSEHGEISDLKLITDRDSGRSRGIAFVEYESKENAEDAIKALNEKEFDGRNIQVNIAKPKEKSGGGGRSFGNNRSGFSNNRNDYFGNKSSSGGGYSNKGNFGYVRSNSKQKTPR